MVVLTIWQLWIHMVFVCMLHSCYRCTCHSSATKTLKQLEMASLSRRALVIMYFRTAALNFIGAQTSFQVKWLFLSFFKSFSSNHYVYSLCLHKKKKNRFWFIILRSEIVFFIIHVRHTWDKHESQGAWYLGKCQCGPFTFSFQCECFNPFPCKTIWKQGSFGGYLLILKTIEGTGRATWSNIFNNPHSPFVQN